MSKDSNPFASVGVGITLGLALAAVVVSTVIKPETIPLDEKFQYIFAALFLGTSIGHFLGEAMISGGENKKNALVGLFSTLGVLFVVFLWYGQGLTIFAGAIGGTLIFFTACLILSHHSKLIADSERLDDLVSKFAGRLSPGGLGIIVVSFVADMALAKELATTISQITIGAVSILIAFFVLKYREPIMDEVEPLLNELKSSEESKDRG